MHIPVQTEERFCKIKDLILSKKNEFLFGLKDSNQSYEEISRMSDELFRSINLGVRQLSYELQTVIHSENLHLIFETTSESIILVQKFLNGLLHKNIEINEKNLAQISIGKNLKMDKNNNDNSFSRNMSLIHKELGRPVEIEVQFPKDIESDIFKRINLTKEIDEIINRRKAETLLRKFEGKTIKEDEIRNIRDPFLLIEMSQQIERGLLENIEKSNFETKGFLDMDRTWANASENNPIELLASIRNKMGQFLITVTGSFVLEKTDLKEMFKNFEFLNREIVDLKKKAGVFLLNEYTKIKERFYVTGQFREIDNAPSEKGMMTEPPRFAIFNGLEIKQKIEQKPEYFLTILMNLDLQNFELKERMSQLELLQQYTQEKNNDIKLQNEEKQAQLKNTQINNLSKEQIFESQNEEILIQKDKTNQIEIEIETEILKTRFLNILGFVSKVFKKLSTDVKIKKNKANDAKQKYTEEFLTLINHPKLVELSQISSTFCKLFKTYKSNTEIESFEKSVIDILRQKMTNSQRFETKKCYSFHKIGDLPEKTKTEEHFKFFLENLLKNKATMFDFKKYFVESFEITKKNENDITDQKSDASLAESLKNKFKKKMTFFLRQISDFTDFLSNAPVDSLFNNSYQQLFLPPQKPVLRPNPSTDIYIQLTDVQKPKLSKTNTLQGSFSSNKLRPSISNAQKLKVDKTHSDFPNSRKDLSKNELVQIKLSPVKNNSISSYTSFKPLKQISPSLKIQHIFCVINFRGRILSWEIFKQKEIEQTKNSMIKVINLNVDLQNDKTSLNNSENDGKFKQKTKSCKRKKLRSYFQKNKTGLNESEYLNDLCDYVIKVFNPEEIQENEVCKSGNLKLPTEIKNDQKTQIKVTNSHSQLNQLVRPDNKVILKSSLGFRKGSLNDHCVFAKETLDNCHFQTRNSTSAKQLPKKKSVQTIKKNLIAFKISSAYYNQIFLQKNSIQGVALNKKKSVICVTGTDFI